MVRKIFITRVARSIVIVSAVLSVSAAAKEIEINNFEELREIGVSKDYPLTGDYVLVNDITIPKADAGKFKPIGNKNDQFTGKFRGIDKKTGDKKTHVIRGLYINLPNEHDVGLFGYVGRGGEVSHIGVVADTAIGDYSVGVLAGTNKGLIEDCFGAGVVRAGVNARSQTESSAGGLVGFNGGEIERSYSAASVRGRQYVGGLAGFLTVDPVGRITESYATGEVSGTVNYAGGLVGYIFDGKIEKCFSTGRVRGDEGERVMVGGLVGGDFGGSNTSWNVRGKNGTGGYIKDAEIKNSFWDKNTSGVDHSVGGEGKTSEEMKDPGTFAGWDFDTTWNIKTDANYPQLQEVPVCTLTYRAGINGKLMVGGVVLPQDSVFTVVLEEGSRAPEVTAVPDNENYRFENWSDKRGLAARADVASKDTSVNVMALFLMTPDAEKNSCKLVYIVHDGQEAYGTLRVNATGVVMESSKYGMMVVKGARGFEVTAVPAEGYNFVTWCDKDTADPVRSDIAPKDRDSVLFTALFARKAGYADPADAQYPLIYTSGAGGELRSAGDARLLAFSYTSHKNGDTGPLIAAFPEKGYRFAGWNDAVSTLTRSDVAKPNAVFMAVFEEVTDTIYINNFGELRKIGVEPNYPLSGNYILRYDISAAGDNGFKPIGSEEEPFTGTFDGSMKTISGLNIDRTGENFTGLFGYAKNARISRVYLAGASVSGGNNTGALVGACLNTVIDSCGVDGEVAGADSVGGLVGSAASSLISRSYSTAAVGGKNGTGGLAGVAAGSIVTHCYAAGKADGTGAGVGGLIGRAGAGAAQYSYAVVITQGASAVGGFVGEAARGAKFYQCYSAGYAYGRTGSAGGFAGAVGADGVAVDMCYWNKETSGQDLSAGGLGDGYSDILMMIVSTYSGWDFNSVWGIEGGESYPYLLEVKPPSTAYPGMYKPKQASARQADKRLVRVRGRVMTINAPQGAAWQVRLIDMRGRTVAKYNVQNTARIMLNRIPSGRYMVETRNRGKRVNVSAIVLK